MKRIFSKIKSISKMRHNNISFWLQLSFSRRNLQPWSKEGEDEALLQEAFPAQAQEVVGDGNHPLVLSQVVSFVFFLFFASWKTMRLFQIIDHTLKEADDVTFKWIWVYIQVNLPIFFANLFKLIKQQIETLCLKKWSLFSLQINARKSNRNTII
jgi:hypothetical protein